MPFHVSITDNSSEIVRVYHQGITLKGEYYVGLKAFVSYNSISNISDTYSNTSFDFKNPNTGEKVSIRIPPGTYEMKQLFKCVTEKAKKKGITITFKLYEENQEIEMNCDYVIDFTTPTSVCKILGYSPYTYAQNTTLFSDRLPMLFTINTIKVKCNLINSSINNFKLHDTTLYEFPLATYIGEKIVERPASVSYYKVNTDIIHTLSLSIVDQDDRPVNFQGERITLILEFRPWS